MNLEDLKVVIPYQWKIQSVWKDWKQNEASKEKWVCVAYIDARDCMDLLDNVCWPQNRQTRFLQVKNTMFCEVWIKVDNEWVWKSDAWTEAPKEGWADAQFKWEASDAFKRGCVQWWIWRFLYDMWLCWITQEEYNKNKYTLSEYINKTKWIKPLETIKEKPLSTKEQLQVWLDKVKTLADDQKEYPSKPKLMATISERFALDESAYQSIENFYTTILF